MLELVFILIVAVFFVPRLITLVTEQADAVRRMNDAKEDLSEQEFELARLETFREALMDWRRRGCPGECPELEDIDYPDDEGEVQRLVRQATLRMDSGPEGSR